MARWLIRRDSKEVTLVREHMERGVKVLFECGSKRGAVSDGQVVGWILDAGVANPWDHVVLSDGTELPLQPPVKA